MKRREVIAEMVHEEFRPSPSPPVAAAPLPARRAQARHGAHAATESPTKWTGRRAFAVVASGGLACAVAGALMGGLGGSFSVTPAPAQTVQTSGEATLGSSGQTAKQTDAGPAQPGRTTAAIRRATNPSTPSTARGGRSAGVGRQTSVSPSTSGKSEQVSRGGAGGATGSAQPDPAAAAPDPTGLTNVLANVIALLTGGLAPTGSLPGVSGVVAPVQTTVTGVADALSKGLPGSLTLPQAGTAPAPLGSTGSSRSGTGTGSASTTTTTTSSSSPSVALPAVPDTVPTLPTGVATPAPPLPCVGLPGISIAGLTPTTSLSLCAGS